MCDPLYENMDNGQLSGIVFLDIRKAFDSIDHNILLHKLKDQFGISDIELRWFESYLNNREQVCIVNNLMSSSKRIVSGVPQGSILGPLLFLLYINDLPDCLQKTSPYLYADDTQICCSSNSLIELTENLNHDLSRIGDWLSRNKLQHHPTKTKIMFIGSKHHINSTTFFWDNLEIRRRTTKAILMFKVLKDCWLRNGRSNNVFKKFDGKQTSLLFSAVS